ncbi:MAG: zinc ribbon domain-containing protein [Thermoplasmatota archaeon]
MAMRCPNCGTERVGNGIYCTQCEYTYPPTPGTSPVHYLPSRPKANMQRKSRCSACKTPVSVDATACPGCGAVFVEPEAHAIAPKSLSSRPKADMFQCPACNTLVNLDAKSCPGCGAVPVELEPPAIAPENPSSRPESPSSPPPSKNGMKPGLKVAVRCPKCGTERTGTGIYCAQCEHSFITPASRHEGMNFASKLLVAFVIVVFIGAIAGIAWVYSEPSSSSSSPTPKPTPTPSPTPTPPPDEKLQVSVYNMCDYDVKIHVWIANHYGDDIYEKAGDVWLGTGWLDSSHTFELNGYSNAEVLVKLGTVSFSGGIWSNTIPGYWSDGDHLNVWFYPDGAKYDRG